MPVTLKTTLSRIKEVPNEVNATLIEEYYQHLKSNGTGETHQINMIKDVTNFAKTLKPELSFFDIKGKEGRIIILKYLDSKLKSAEDDPEEYQKSITSWNDYLGRLKAFFRWMHNCRLKNPDKVLPIELWKTPDFIAIPRKKTKRLSPYTATQIWELDELLTIVKYEPNPRNKAALTMQWDFFGRNKEVCSIQNKHIRFREKFAEGEIPHSNKTGSSAFLLRASFPYALVWYNQHPLKDNPEAFFICNQMNGKKIKPGSLWRVMKVLKFRIENLLRAGAIKNEAEKEKLEYLLKTKAWNPYAIRHSSITDSADYLPEFGLRKIVRWSMNSKQPARYIKNKMGESLRNQILSHDGIVDAQETRPKARVLQCPRCNTMNALENKLCSNPVCMYPLTTQGFEEVKGAEEELKQKYANIERQLIEMSQRFEQREQDKLISSMKLLAVIAKKTGDTDDDIKALLREHEKELAQYVVNAKRLAAGVYTDIGLDNDMETYRRELEHFAKRKIELPAQS